MVEGETSSSAEYPKSSPRAVAEVIFFDISVTFFEVFFPVFIKILFSNFFESLFAFSPVKKEFFLQMNFQNWLKN